MNTVPMIRGTALSPPPDRSSVAWALRAWAWLPEAGMVVVGEPAPFAVRVPGAWGRLVCDVVGLVGGSVYTVERCLGPLARGDDVPPWPVDDFENEPEPEPDDPPVPVADEPLPGGAGRGGEIGVVGVVPTGVVVVGAVVVVVGVVVDAQREAKLAGVVGGGSLGFPFPGFWNRQPRTAPLVTVADAPVSAYFHRPEADSKYDQ
jgi:hypothetical protein